MTVGAGRSGVRAARPALFMNAIAEVRTYTCPTCNRLSCICPMDIDPPALCSRATETPTDNDPITKDAYRAIIHQLATRLQITTINLPGMTTELGPRATVKRGEQFYHVNSGDQRGGS